MAFTFTTIEVSSSFCRSKLSIERIQASEHDLKSLEGKLGDQTFYLDDLLFDCFPNRKFQPKLIPQYSMTAPLQALQPSSVGVLFLTTEWMLGEGSRQHSVCLAWLSACHGPERMFNHCWLSLA